MGRATALTFAREGALVVGCDVAVEPAEETVELVRAAGGEMVSLQPCRLSDPADCAALVELAVREFGRIDVLFNLAGRSHFGRLEDVTDEEWDAARRDEVDLVFYLTRAAWPHLKASRGVVVNMASLNGSAQLQEPRLAAHTTNKAAIIGMTRQLALEGSEHGIRVNSISPGLIESSATRAQLEDEALGSRDARQDAPGPARPARGRGERRAVPRLRRELVRHRHRRRRRWRHEGLVTRGERSAITATERQRPAAARGRTSRHRSGFWAVAFAFLIVMAFATLPSPLYGLYRIRDDLSAFTVTVIYAIFAAGTIATLLSVRFIAARIGRRGVMLAAVATMIGGGGVLAAWKALPGLLVGRLITGVAVGLAAGTAITYLIELRVREDPNASVIRARNIGTAVNVGALGIGPLIAGCLAEWARLPLTLPYLVWIALGAVALIGLAAAPETASPDRRARPGVTHAARQGRPGFSFPRRWRPLQPSRRTGCSPGCPGCSWPPRSGGRPTHWPAQRCSWCSPRVWRLSWLTGGLPASRVFALGIDLDARRSRPARDRGAPFDAEPRAVSAQRRADRRRARAPSSRGRPVSCSKRRLPRTAWR